MKCKICGDDGDLFANVTQQPACSICVVTFGLGSPVRQADIDTIRKALKLEDGAYLKIDRGKAARILLGRDR